MLFVVTREELFFHCISLISVFTFFAVNCDWTMPSRYTIGHRSLLLALVSQSDCEMIFKLQHAKATWGSSRRGGFESCWVLSVYLDWRAL